MPAQRLAFNIRSVLHQTPLASGASACEEDSLLGRPAALPTSTAGKTNHGLPVLRGSGVGAGGSRSARGGQSQNADMGSRATWRGRSSSAVDKPARLARSGEKLCAVRVCRPLHDYSQPAQPRRRRSRRRCRHNGIRASS